ncbi:hypothetical protein VTO42DRAFT_5410 [Malbranchea cinnamomea]
MQLKSLLLLFSSVASLTSALPHAKRGDWRSIPSDGKFSTEGFGQRKMINTGTIDTYQGNVGDPWGSNIIEISGSDAPKYKYVAQIKGQNTEPWTVVFWNKFGPDGRQDGHYGRSALRFTLNPGETKYVAFDENTQGGFGAIGGNGELPKGNMGAYACTWGEFDLGNKENNGWSGFDVSAIQAQLSKKDVQGMQICDVLNGGGACSSISSGGMLVNNAYTAGEINIGGIGGNLPAGPVRLAVVIDYKG